MSTVRFLRTFLPCPPPGRFRMLFLGDLFVVYCCLMAKVIAVSVLEGKRV